MGLYTPAILGGNSYPSWFYDKGAIKDPAHTETSKGLSQATNRGPIRKFLPKYANVYVTIQSHGLSAGARTHYVTANGVRNGIRLPVIRCCAGRIANAHACCAGSGHFLPLPPSMAQPSPTFMNCHNNRAEIGFSRYFLGSRERA